MHITADDIKHEHDEALASLSATQRRAIDRLARARRMTTFNHRWARENLESLFEAEAAEHLDGLSSAA